MRKKEILEFDEIFEMCDFIKQYDKQHTPVEIVLKNNLRSFLVVDWWTGNEKGRYFIKVYQDNIKSKKVVAYVTLSEDGLTNLYKVLTPDQRNAIRGMNTTDTRILEVGIGQIMHDAYKKRLRQ